MLNIFPVPHGYDSFYPFKQLNMYGNAHTKREVTEEIPV